MGWVLYAAGETVDPKELLADVTFVPHEVFVKGAPSGIKDKPYLVSGFTFIASDADDLPRQEKDLRAALSAHWPSFSRVLRDPSVQQKHVDFACTLRIGSPGVDVQGESFSAETLRMLAELGLDLFLSIYPRVDEQPRRRRPRAT